MTDVNGISPESPNHLRVLTNQANDSWLACFATSTRPLRGYRRARENAHQLFASEPSLLRIPECLQDSILATVGKTVFSGCCSVLLLHLSMLELLFCSRAGTSPGRFNTFPFLKEQYVKEQYLKELHERQAPF